MGMMKKEQQKLIADLDAINALDPEQAHTEADHLIIASLPEDVRMAYLRVQERCPGSFLYA